MAKTSKKTATKKAAAGDESKADKFKRLGSMRVTKAINAMRGLQKLSNRNNYEYSPEQVEKILGALKSEVESVYAAFTKKSGEAKNAFEL